MMGLDEISSIDSQRKILINQIKRELYDFIRNEKICGCTIKSVKSDRIVLHSINELDEDVLKRFEDCFSLTLVRFSHSVTNNLFDSGTYYPLGITEEWFYIFRSSGGLY